MFVDLTEKKRGNCNKCFVFSTRHSVNSHGDPFARFSFEKNYLFGNPSSVNIAISRSSSRIVNCLYIIFGPDVPVAQQRSGRKEPRLEAFELRCLPSLQSPYISCCSTTTPLLSFFLR
jgi:hypothetical protein